MLVIGAIVSIELRLDTPDKDAADAKATADNQPKGGPQSAGTAKGWTGASGEREEQTVSGSSGDAERSGSPERDTGEKQAVSDAERIANKENEYSRAREITGSTGLINTDGVSIRDAAGEKVVLVEFWTYSCFNCQDAQPHINALYEEYNDDGLLVIGVHTPEFGFEKEISNVREAVRQANIRYPVMLETTTTLSGTPMGNASGRRGT